MRLETEKKIPYVFTVFLLFQLFLTTANAQKNQTDKKIDEEQPKFALLVGISQYKNNNQKKIDGCVNNVDLLAQTLKENYGFKNNEVDATLINEKATKKAIIEKFRTFLVANAREAKRNGKEAVIVYYFCGHGSQTPNQKDDVEDKEDDGKDETFVAYDSRVDDYDILDDEMDDLKWELRQETSNTTLIFESCHSGSASRGDSLIEQKTEDDKRIPPAYKRKYPPTSDKDFDTYVEIAAASSDKSAWSESEESCNCKTPYSLMTKALVEGLKRASYSTSYRDLIREVSNEVARRSNQEPQVEGNRNSYLFGGKAKRAKPYIEIEDILPDKQIKIKAGAIHGLKEGSQVAIYSESKDCGDSGDDCWLMNGYVSKVNDFNSDVVLKPESESKLNEVKITSHVVLTSPAFGSGSVLLLLNPRKEKFGGEDISLRNNLTEYLKGEDLIENQTVKLIEADKLTPKELKDSAGIVRLKKGILKVKKQPDKSAQIILVSNSDYSVKKRKAITTEIVLNGGESLKPETFCEGNNVKKRNEEERLPTDNSEVYYLDDGESGGTPLFGRMFDVNEDKNELARKFSTLIRSYAYQSMLKRLDNKASQLPNMFKVTLQKVNNVELIEKCADGKLRKVAKTSPKLTDFIPAKESSVPFGTIYNFNLKNISEEEYRKIKKDSNAGGLPFFVSVIFLRATGEINVLYPKLSEKDQFGVNTDKNMGGYIASNPIGVEQLVVIVSKDYADFSFYETEFSSYKTKGTPRGSESPLVRMLTQRGSKSRDSGIESDKPDTWGVIHFDVKIIEK